VKDPEQKLIELGQIAFFYVGLDIVYNWNLHTVVSLGFRVIEGPD
jgi:hypothetical protein